jgi:putative transcriptional regulator
VGAVRLSIPAGAGRALAVLLLVVAVLATTASFAQDPPRRRALAGRLLVATETLRDPRFARSVIYVVRHNEQGAFGLVINVPMGEVPFEQALRPLGLEVPPGSGDLRVHYGGPVEPRHGFVLHTPDWKSDDTIVVDGRFALTEDPKILHAMAGRTGPRRALFLLGYAGWAPGQLDAEMTSGSWGVAVADERLVFELDHAQKWIEAMARRILEL